MSVAQHLCSNPEHVAQVITALTGLAVAALCYGIWMHADRNRYRDELLAMYQEDDE
jgi:hypothetical protein